MPLSLATIRQLRRIVIGALAVATTVLAITLIVHALSPTGLGLAPTSQLLAILLLLTLPACTIAAWAWDRSVRKRTAAWAAAKASTETTFDLESGLEADLDAGLASARVHPAGRTKPHEAPAQDDGHDDSQNDAHADDTGTPIFLDQDAEPKPEPKPRPVNR